MYTLQKLKMPKLKIDRKKIFSLISITIILSTMPVNSHFSNQSNIIDRRKTIDLESSYDDQNIDDQTAPPPTIGCGSCKFREDVKTRNLEAIKGEVLRRMGFESAPNVTGRVLPQVPPHILAKIQDQGYGGMQSDEPQFKTGPSVFVEEDDFHIKTETVVTFAQTYPRLRHSWKGHDILHFQFSDSITKYQVSNATLYVYVKGVEKRPAPTFHLEIFKVFKSAEHSETPGMLKVSSKKVSQPVGRAGDWIEVDITVLVSEWFKTVRENLGFVINGSVNGKRVVYADSAMMEKGTNGKIPFVQISTHEAKRRVRRNLGLNCDGKSDNPLCCRYPLTVDFEEFGFDFIIAPKRYEAYYCHGECPYITMQKHAHTHLMQMAIPNSSPCCAPKKMSAISMLYFDQQMSVVYGSLPGMVVERCGCS